MQLKRGNRLKMHGLRDKSFSPVIVGIRDKFMNAPIEMMKEVSDQIELIKTRRMARKVSRSKDMSNLGGGVVNLEESVEDIRETLEAVEGCTNELDLMKEKLMDFVLDSFDSTKEKLTGRDDALKAMVTALKEEISELKREFTIYKVALSSRMLALRLNQRAIDVPKLKKFKGVRSAKEVDNFLWEIK